MDDKISEILAVMGGLILLIGGGSKLLRALIKEVKKLKKEWRK